MPKPRFRTALALLAGRCLKKSACLLLAALLCAGCVSCAPPAESAAAQPPGNQTSAQSQPAAPPQQPSSTPQSGAQSEFTADYLQVPSPALAQNLIDEPASLSAGLILPPGYAESEAEYPLILYLTGFSEDYTARTEAFAQALNTLRAQGAAPDVIVAVASGQSRLGGGFYTDSPVSGGWQSAITQDLLSYLAAQYRILPDARNRGLCGHSMGGAGALSIAMQQPGLFGSVYALSPAIFRDEDFSTVGVHFQLIQEIAARYEGLSPEDAALQYSQDINTLPGQYFWPLAYASAFAPDEGAAPPHIRLPGQNADGTWQQDAVLDAYLSGGGALAAKAGLYAGNLQALSALAIDYGKSDENSWIPPGCEELGAQLAANGVPHTLTPYEGTHNSEVDARIQTVVLPFFFGQFESLAQA